MKNRIDVIGDIHGELDMLQRAITRIEADGGTDAKVITMVIVCVWTLAPGTVSS